MCGSGVAGGRASVKIVAATDSAREHPRCAARALSHAAYGGADVATEAASASNSVCVSARLIARIMLARDIQCIERSDATRLRKFVNYEPTCRTQRIMRKALDDGMEQAHQSFFLCVFCVRCVCVPLYVCMCVCVYSCSYLVCVNMLMRTRGRICACVSLRVYALARARTCACITFKHFHVRHCRARRNLQSKLPRAAAQEEGSKMCVP